VLEKREAILCRVYACFDLSVSPVAYVLRPALGSALAFAAAPTPDFAGRQAGRCVAQCMVCRQSAGRVLTSGATYWGEPHMVLRTLSLLKELGQTKVSNLHGAVIPVVEHDHVLQLEIPVHDACQAAM